MAPKLVMLWGSIFTYHLGNEPQRFLQGFESSQTSGIWGILLAAAGWVSDISEISTRKFQLNIVTPLRLPQLIPNSYFLSKRKHPTWRFEIERLRSDIRLGTKIMIRVTSRSSRKAGRYARHFWIQTYWLYPRSSHSSNATESIAAPNMTFQTRISHDRLL